MMLKWITTCRVNAKVLHLPKEAVPGTVTVLLLTWQRGIKTAQCSVHYDLNGQGQNSTACATLYGPAVSFVVRELIENKSYFQVYLGCILRCK